MSATIKYKGNTIASITTDTSKTLRTSGKYCEADIVVENTQDGGITPSGTISITENGNIDVTNYANANVNVPQGITPSGQISITENGTFDVTSFASALVNVSGGGDLPDWIEVGEFTPQQNINTYTISHNKGIVPQAVAYVDDDLFSTATYLAKVGFGYKYADGGIGGGCAFNGYNGSFGGFATNYPGVTDMNESTVTIATRSGSYYFKVGYTYKYIIIFKEEE